MDHQSGSDAALVSAFCDAPDDVARQQAFSALLHRHGAMVLGTCRRITGNNTDAEDAAQAVFITLASKARQLRDHPTLGGWLHRSARNISLRQREAAKTRTRYEGQQEAHTMSASSDGLDERLRTDLREELDHALDYLAERYRVPLVLHYLDGHSQEDVARILKLKEGTLASLLSRGRELLRQQLHRKGLTVGALTLTTFLVSESSAHAALPASFVAATAQSASAIAASSFTVTAAAGSAAPHVIALATGGTATVSALKLTAASILALSALTLGTFTAVSVGAESNNQPVLTTTSDNVEPVKTPSTDPIVKPAAATDQPVLDAETAEAAVMAAVKALRINDAAAYLRRLDPEGQQQAEASWKNISTTVVSNPWVGGMFSRMLRVSDVPNAQELIANYVTPILLNIEANNMANGLAANTAPQTDEHKRYRGGVAQLALNSVINGVINGTLASGIESEQITAIKKYLGAVAAWLPHAGFSDKEKAKLASQAIADALGKFGTTNIRELTKLELAQLLDRVSLALPDVKRAFAVYDLHIDKALDSVSVTSTPIAEATIVRITFTAFDMEHTFPIKMVTAKKNWTVSADSPLPYWLEQRGLGITTANGATPFTFAPFDRGNFNNGRPPQQRGGGFNGGDRRGNQPAEPAPEPTTDPGF